jgi:hypothetical protein
VPYNPNHHNVYKPQGLWVSVEGEDDWLSWCKGEHWNLSAFKYAHEIVLEPFASILRLKTAKELREFSKEFEAAMPYDSIHKTIDWKRIREGWQGIIIAPYVWECRLDLDTFWYYGWDCASGAIWDKDAVAEIRKIEPPNLEG